MIRDTILLTVRVFTFSNSVDFFFFLIGNGQYFSPILDYLRTGELFISPKLPFQAVYR